MDSKAVGAYIRYLRTHAPFISQEELADRAGLSSGSYISRIENGAKGVSNDIYEAIAFVFNLGIGDLFTGAGLTVHPEKAYFCTFAFQVVCNKDQQTAEVIPYIPNGKKTA